MVKSLTLKKVSGEKTQFARIYLMAYFQEIWDFTLTFDSFKAFNTINRKGLPMNPQIKLIL